jgi:cytochrome c peroxidase
MAQRTTFAISTIAITLFGGVFSVQAQTLDSAVTTALQQAGFTGRIQSTLETRLGRPVNPQLANLGRLLWFDNKIGLHSDNTCGGCHSPATGFGDSQSIAIGIQSNEVVGPDRSGPRNQRRSPSPVNAAFYPKLMWNGRFRSRSGNPFDNSSGFRFPLPEGLTKFAAHDPNVTHLLIAHGHMPPTELTEAAGFTGTAGTLGPDFVQFDDGRGSMVPAPDSSGFRNDPIRQAMVTRLNATPAYRALFAALFPAVASGGPITPLMFARAIAEFEFTLVFANAPVDHFARGETTAMTTAEKQGALIFFGKGKCAGCHKVGGASNEMFSDFNNHVVGVPQIAPYFGVGKGNVIFDGLGQNEDFGLEQDTGLSTDRYKFRTSPLRNAALQPAFFHNGAFKTIDAAIRHHLDVFTSARNYNAVTAGVAKDLTYRLGPIEPVLSRIDPQLAAPIALTTTEFDDLVAFVRDGLLDPGAKPANLCKLVPATVPSGATVQRFPQCKF